MWVWKVADRRGRDHLVSLRHFSRQSELRVDGVRTATVAHSMWRDDDLLLPFTVNDDQHGNVRIKQSMWSQPVYQCSLEGSEAEETSLLPPSSLIEKICIPRYEVPTPKNTKLRHKSVDRGLLPAVFRQLRTVFPGLGAGFLNLGGKMGRTAKKWGKNEQKWARKWPKKSGGKLT